MNVCKAVVRRKKENDKLPMVVQQVDFGCFCAVTDKLTP